MDVASVAALTRELGLRKRLQEAVVIFSKGVASRSTVDSALETLARDVTAVLEVRRASVWLHDRESRQLTLAGSSSPSQSDQSTPTTDPSPLAAALRQEAPQLDGSGDDAVMAAPLRGWRRALGVLVIEGTPARMATEIYVDVIRDFATQLSIALENVLVLQDVITQHAAQQEHRERHAPAEKLAALGQFIAGIAHELNNPLQGVLGHVELLIATAPQGTQLRADLRRVYADADRAAKVVRNLLVFTGSGKASRRRIDVERLIARSVAVRRSSLKRAGIQVAVTCEAGLPQVVGDQTLLQQALVNVIQNAEQAISDAADAGRVHIKASAERHRVVIAIEDNGPGIDPQAAPRIFEPFFTTKEMGKGTGLGLAITSGILQEHGGSIAAASSILGGAKFVIQLPAAGC